MIQIQPSPVHILFPSTGTPVIPPLLRIFLLFGSKVGALGTKYVLLGSTKQRKESKIAT